MTSHHSNNSSPTNETATHIFLDVSSNVDRNRGCNRLRSEWSLSLFSLKDTTGQVIDLKETFAYRRFRFLYGVCKATAVAATLSMMMGSISRFSADDKEFWLAHLPHWGLIMCFATNLFNLLIFLYFQAVSTNTIGGLNVNLEAGIVKVIWAISVVAINVALLSVVLYWMLDYYNLQTPEWIQYWFLVLYTTLDVLGVNRIPIRLKQILFVILFELLYFLWLIIHAVADIGTPFSDEDPTTDDDAIYSAINWNKRPGIAALVMIGILLLLTPLLFSFLWFLSSLLQPRYRDGSVDVNVNVNATVHDNSGSVAEDDQEPKQDYDRSDTIDFSEMKCF